MIAGLLLTAGLLTGLSVAVWVVRSDRQLRKLEDDVLERLEALARRNRSKLEIDVEVNAKPAHAALSAIAEDLEATWNDFAEIEGQLARIREGVDALHAPLFACPVCRRVAGAGEDCPNCATVREALGR